MKVQESICHVVDNPWITYNIQDIFNSEGYFEIKVSPLGANLCFPEEREEGEIIVLVESEVTS